MTGIPVDVVELERALADAEQSLVACLAAHSPEEEPVDTYLRIALLSVEAAREELARELSFQ